MTAASPTQPGLVVANYGQTLLIEAADGTTVACVARKSAGQPVCGDRVLWQRERGADHGVVVAIEPRRSLLARPDGRGKPRPLCSNVDQLIVVSAVPPAGAGSGINYSLADHYLVTAELLGLEAVLIVNKIDLAGPSLAAGLQEETACYRAAGYEVRFLSARTGQGLPETDSLLRSRTSILVGESGVGKSSLLQTLLPGQAVRVGELSAASGKGRHTTTSTLLFHLPAGGDVIDSPGVREFRLWSMSPAELARGFREFEDFLGRCRFRDCRHTGEPGCAVAAGEEQGAISRRRLDSYRMILRALPPADYGV
jgi:ribosome biogenesis GTPase